VANPSARVTFAGQVLIFLRFALRAFALAGRRPWLAFLILRRGLVIFLLSETTMSQW